MTIDSNSPSSSLQTLPPVTEWITTTTPHTYTSLDRDMARFFKLEKDLRILLDFNIIKENFEEMKADLLAFIKITTSAWKIQATIFKGQAFRYELQIKGYLSNIGSEPRSPEGRSLPGGMQDLSKKGADRKRTEKKFRNALQQLGGIEERVRELMWEGIEWEDSGTESTSRHSKGSDGTATGSIRSGSTTIDRIFGENTV